MPPAFEPALGAPNGSGPALEAAEPIVYVNGKRRVLPDGYAETTLLEYLRGRLARRRRLAIRSRLAVNILREVHLSKVMRGYCPGTPDELPLVVLSYSNRCLSFLQILEVCRFFPLLKRTATT
jgi:hypothetical protein